MCLLDPRTLDLVDVTTATVGSANVSTSTVHGQDWVFSDNGLRQARSICGATTCQVVNPIKRAATRLMLANSLQANQKGKRCLTFLTVDFWPEGIFLSCCCPRSFEDDSRRRREKHLLRKCKVEQYLTRSFSGHQTQTSGSKSSRAEVFF